MDTISSLEQFICSSEHNLYIKELQEGIRLFRCWYYSIDRNNGDSGNALSIFFFFLYDELSIMDVADKQSYEKYVEIKECVRWIIDEYRKNGNNKDANSIIRIMVPYELAFCFFAYSPETYFLRLLSEVYVCEGKRMDVGKPLAWALEIEYIFRQEMDGGSFSNYYFRRNTLLQVVDGLIKQSYYKEAFTLIDSWLNMCDNSELTAISKGGIFHRNDYRCVYDYIARLYDGDSNHLLNLLLENDSCLIEAPFILICTNDRYGFIDKSGDVVVPCLYKNAMIAESDRFLTVQQNDNTWVIIDLCNPENNFGNLISSVISRNNVISFLSPDGILTTLFPDNSKCLFPYGGEIGKLIGFLNRDRFLCVEMKLSSSLINELNDKYRTTIKYVCGKAPNLTLVNVIDTLNNKFLFPKDTVSYSTYDGTVFVVNRVTLAMADYSENTIFEVYNNDGDVLVNQGKYDDIFPFTKDGIARVAKGKNYKERKYGFIDKNGKEIIPVIYSYANDFSEGYAAVRMEYDRYGYIDINGSLVIACQYENAGNFNNGIAPVKLNNSNNFEKGNNRYCYITKQGAILDGRYQYATNFHRGKRFVVINNRLMEIDSEGFIRNTFS